MSFIAIVLMVASTAALAAGMGMRMRASLLWSLRREEHPPEWKRVEAMSCFVMAGGFLGMFLGLFFSPDILSPQSSQPLQILLVYLSAAALGMALLGAFLYRGWQKENRSLAVKEA